MCEKLDHGEVLFGSNTSTLLLDDLRTTKMCCPLPVMTKKNLDVENESTECLVLTGLGYEA